MLHEQSWIGMREVLFCYMNRGLKAVQVPGVLRQAGDRGRGVANLLHHLNWPHHPRTWRKSAVRALMYLSSEA